MSEVFFAGNQIVSAFIPVDMQTAANAGDWVSLKNHNRAVCVLFKAVGTAGDDPVFKLQQAKDNAGGSAKDLNFSVIFKKIGDQTAAGQNKFTRATQTAATSHTDAVSAEAAAIMAVEVDASELDVANGFNHIQLSVADIGANAQLGAAFYLLMEPRYGEEPSVTVQ